MTTLGTIIGQAESGNNPHASATDAFGNVSANVQFQQSPAFIAQYGAGEPGVISLATTVLNANPNATLGDFYAAYNSGFNASTGAPSIPFSSYQAGITLSNGVNLGSNLNNLNRAAGLSGATANTPLSTLTGTPLTSGDSVAFGEENADGTINANGNANSAASDGSASSFDQFSGLGAGDATNTGGLTNPALQGGAGNLDASAGNPLGFGTSSAQTPNGTFQTVTPSAPSSDAASGSAAFTSGGPPLEITNASDVGQIAGQNIQSGLNTAGSDAQKGLNTAAQAVTSSESNAATTATSLTNTLLSGVESWFVNGSLVVLGLLVLAGAFLFFYMERKNVVELAKV